MTFLNNNKLITIIFFSNITARKYKNYMYMYMLMEFLVVYGSHRDSYSGACAT